MLKLMIVDDEAFVRIGIRSSIDWEKNGFEVAAEAENGEQALVLCRKHRPEILMTDIKMPCMNGIELIRAMKQEKMETKIVILSCHEEFHYLREAMRLGIEDYLLKVGLMPENILSVLNKIKQKYWGDFAVTEGNAQNRIEALESIIMGYVDSKTEVEQLIAQHQLELPLDSYCMLRMRIDREGTARPFHENAVLCKTLLGLLHDALVHQFVGEVVQCGDNLFVALVYPCEAVSEQSAWSKIQELASLLIHTVRQALSLKIGVGISRIHHGAEYFAQAGAEAREALNMRFFSSNGDCVFSLDRANSRLMEEAQECRPQMQKGVQSICEALLRGDTQNIVQLIAQSKAEMAVRHRDEAYARIYFTNVYLTVLEVLESVGLPPDRLKQKYVGLENIVLHGKSLEEIATRVQNLALEVAESYAEFRMRKKNAVISQVLDYVERSYADNISLKTISQRFNINAAYFCKLFKQVTGKTFVEHLTSKRIAQAQRLLRDTDMRSYAVAEAVGFLNVEYFSRIFHHQVGLSPKEYRNTCRKSGTKPNTENEQENAT